MVKIQNNAARQYDFSLLLKSAAAAAAEGQPPTPVTKRFVFVPTDVVEMSEQEFESLKRIPLFSSALNDGHLSQIVEKVEKKAKKADSMMD